MCLAGVWPCDEASSLAGMEGGGGVVMCGDDIALEGLNLWSEAVTPESSISSTCDYSTETDRVCTGLLTLPDISDINASLSTLLSSPSVPH